MINYFENSTDNLKSHDCDLRIWFDCDLRVWIWGWIMKYWTKLFDTNLSKDYKN